MYMYIYILPCISIPPFGTHTIQYIYIYIYIYIIYTYILLVCTCNTGTKRTSM